MSGRFHRPTRDTRRLYDPWLATSAALYMDSIYLPLKQTEHAVDITLPNLEELARPGIRSSAEPGSSTGTSGDRSRFYNHGRELMQQFYELRKAERPPVNRRRDPRSGQGRHAPAREQFNELLEQLLREINARAARSRRASG